MAVSQLETLLPPLVIVVTGAVQATVRAGVTYSTTGSDRGCKRPTLHNGSGLYLFHNNCKSFQDVCRDEHQDVRILQAEAL